ncbi:MAG: sensor histidine kinase [Pirellulales bacterium]
MPTEDVLESGSLQFKAEARLLQELGLRLVASPEVALVELIKNAYDADASECNVSLSNDGNTIIVTDDGHGMSLSAFTQRWMQIATSSKASTETSPKYKRALTGAKGIGRFAVRYLGDSLVLQSNAYDASRKKYTRLEAHFDWRSLDQSGALESTQVPYRLLSSDKTQKTGTQLRITGLREAASFVRSKDLRNRVLALISPTQGLEAGKFKRETNAGGVDPGFRVSLPGEDEEHVGNLAELILNHSWATLKMQLEGSTLTFTVNFPHRKKVDRLSIETRSLISNGFVADIRFFPRRKGVFQAKEVDGRKAWTWVRNNSGVAIVDHGFRIKPYGFELDDWLNLDIDGAHNERDWRTSISKSHFGIPPQIRARPGDNPALNLPHNSQVVGAVFIKSLRTSVATSQDEEDLIPAMDREGLISNASFAQLRDYVRAGIEFLAHCDKKELVRLDQVAAENAAEKARADIKSAIADIKASKTLRPADKAKIVKEYGALAERLEEQEEYASKSRRNIITMSLLGVVAGFMTHEIDELLHELKKTQDDLNIAVKKHPSLRAHSDAIGSSVEALKRYIGYSKLFIQKAPDEQAIPLSSVGQVRMVIARFGKFAEERGIAVKNEVDRQAMTPPLPVTAYSGVLLNLYSNALKALIAVKESIDEPQVVFRGWNDEDRHIIEVLDNGVGIPMGIRKRIWDPLYTTTTSADNPLGSGMGLGLSLVKQVVKELNGSITLLPNAPPGFSTCFRLTFPLRAKTK